jgi:ABC-type Na+ transport system ATPase subunit NatA
MFPPIHVPSAAELAEKYAQLQSIMNSESARSKEVTSTFDLNALKTMASKVVGKECREVLMVGEGVFLNPSLYVFDNPCDILQVASIKYDNPEDFPSHLL